MSKAEERALEAYPKVMSQYSDNCKEYDSNKSDRLTFIEGYHQAEKDLGLTWEDISTLREVLDDVKQEFRKGLHEDKDYIGYCKEVLKRFKERKIKLI